MDYIQTINTGIALHRAALADLIERGICANVGDGASSRSVVANPEPAYVYKTQDIHSTLIGSEEVAEIANLFQQSLGFSNEYALDAAVRFIVLCIGTYSQVMGTTITGAVKASEDFEIFMHYHGVLARAASLVIDGVHGGDRIALSVSIPDYAEILAGLAGAKSS
jgi:hypothetical protein